VTERKLRVTGRLGLHARAAANLVRIANQFRSEIKLRRLDTPLSRAEAADAKSILSILNLAASCGTDLLLTADGVDEEQAINEITVLFVRQFDEGDPIPVERHASTSPEFRVKGLGVSDGVAIGRVLRVQGSTSDLYRASIDEQDIEHERRRFRAAVRASRTQLESIKTRAERESAGRCGAVPVASSRGARAPAAPASARAAIPAAPGRSRTTSRARSHPA